MDGFVTCVNHHRFALTDKRKIYSACCRGGRLYGSETWPVKVDSGIRLEKNYVRMVRSVFSL